MIRKLLLFFTAFTLCMMDANAQTPNASGVLFVNKNVIGGTQSGESWANALPEAADAFKAARLLNDATPGTVTQIWVAGGTYKPKFRADNLNSVNLSDRFNAFVMVPNVGVYGGFAGTETTLAARDLSITSNASILSGDLNNDDGANFSNYGENAYFVVIAAGSMGQATLNGFTISGSNQNNAVNTPVNGRNIYNGGGLAFSLVTLSIDNCIFRSNIGANGGGMGGDDSTLTVTNSSFEGNRATNVGGGFFIINDGYGSAIQHSGIFTNCRFVNNTATTNQSSSIHYDDGNGPGIVFTNCTIYDTTTTGRATHYTKDDLGSEPKFRNTIFSINAGQDLMASPRINEVIFQNCITNKASFGNNINTLNNIVSSDPLFVNAAGGDFTLQTTSPAINAGNTTLFSAGQTPDLSAITTDLNGKDRIVNSIVDMGAYEFGIGVTSVKQDVLCYNDANGSITITIVAGTPPYTYSWNTTPVQTTQNLTALAPGTYTLTVTDDDGLTATHTVTITEPTAALVATAGAQTNILCHGNATGQATVNATGGTGAYSYSWDTTPVQTTATATGLAAGTYIATVTDANGCKATQSFTITEPAALTASAGAQTNVLCNGGATGEATVAVTGGTTGYTYSWDTTPVQTTATATGLAAGTYIATVTDANNCTATQSFTITEPTVLTASAGAQTNVLCHGNATGQATVNATGGTGAYSYSWDTTPVQTTAMATGLAAGTYTATVTDANNCTATQSFTITEPALLTASAGAQTNILCNGNATGQATVNATGGTGAYTYSWDTTPVQTTVMATGLAAGTYTATVTDANNCTATQSFTITEPATAMTLTPNTTQTDVLCNGQATGSATVAVTGGTGVYTYLWSNAATTNTITGLTAGTYTVDVTDANGCILSNSFTITQPAALVASAGTQIDVLCNGNATGSATVNATGGTGAYTYSWDTNPVQTTAMATGLAAGTYIATVYDANQCQTTQSFTITEPPVLIASAGAQLNVLCNGNATGQATVNVTGGTGLYTYSWDTNPVQITPSVTGLTAGTYTVTVTDSNLCTATQSFTITEPSVLNVSVGTQVDVLCFGNNTGSATVNATGGGGAYTYSWDTTPVQTTAMATGLAAGTYTATVTDANGCWATQSFTITEPASAMAFTPNTTQVDVLCNGQATGSATVAVNGGTGAYTYLWSNGGTTNTITGLIAGTYTVTVTDANGCTLNNSFTITQPAALVATAGSQTNILCHGNATGEATVNVTGGTGAYTFNWSPSGGTAATATGLTAGTYTVTVYDANQCQTTQSFTITQPAQPLSMTPNTTQTNVSCFGGANGTASMAVTGGTSPYTYLWSNGQTNAVATGLIAGTYTVTATDANGCTITNSYTITEPVALVATAGPQTNISCFGAANGSATVNATGGTGAYTYSWNTNPVQTTATATNLAPGNYTVTVYDANQCQATQSFTITEPQQLTAAVNNYANVLCYGAATGEATVSVSGGTTPYTYLWNTGQSTAVAANLTAGSYSVIVTDAHGCQANANVTITQPAAPLVATAGAQTNLICNGNTNGSATVNVTGGTGAYIYSWNTTPVQTTATATNLAAGTYTVTVYDANQCQTTQLFTITQPAAVAGYFTVVNSDCHETGSATLHATGGNAPYSYLWSNGNTTPNLLNALPGTYTVTVTDVNGCSNVLSTTINGTIPIVVTSQPQSITINGGETAVFTVEAQNATYYQWQVSTNGGLSFTNLNSGGSSPSYFGVATPTLTVANAYSFIDGYLYRVILMQQSGCYILSDAAELTVNAPVAGIDDIKHLEMNIYPNPASTEVFVKIPDFDLHNSIKLELYDLNGRLIKIENQIKSEEYRLDVSGLESAIYIITITSDKFKTDKKLIVNKKP